MSLNKCAVCWKKDSQLCSSCKSCAYCSKECQKNDWKSHKILCRTLKNETPRPSPSHVRAIYFPEDKPVPELVWIDHKPDEEPSFDPGLLERRVLEELLKRNENDFLSMTQVTRNLRLNKESSSSMIEFHFRNHFLHDGSKPTASMTTAVKPHGPETRVWRGPILVAAVSIEESPEDDEDFICQYIDATLADFRSVIDDSLHYGRYDRAGIFAGMGEDKGSTYGTPATMPNPKANGRETIQGVQYDCDEKGSEVRAVKVTHNHRIRNGEGSISPISTLVGMPIRLRKTAEKFVFWGNEKACWLMKNLNVDDPTWGATPAIWKIDTNNVVAIREDGQDLTIQDAMNLRWFCIDFLKIVKTAIQAGTRQAKVAAMEFVTPENFRKKVDEYKKQEVEYRASLEVLKSRLENGTYRSMSIT